MTYSPQTLVLASRSPRRLELLRRIGIEPIVCPADIDESPFFNEVPIAYVSRVSKCKAETVARQFVNEIVLAADTIVELDGVIFGQPVDESDARRMLHALSANTHRVHTAVSVLRPGAVMRTVVVTSHITFVALNSHLIEWYVATGEPWGKAGAYAVQGAGGVLVKDVQGSLSNVVGLPLREVADVLRLKGARAEISPVRSPRGGC